MDFKAIKALLNERGEKFPVGKGVNVECGRSFSKTGTWWKAVLLVKVRYGKTEKYQLRLYGWQRNKEGIYKLRQKYNISASPYVSQLINAIRLFVEESGKESVLESIYEEFRKQVSQLEREKKRLEHQKSRLPELKKAIQLLEGMLKERKINERAVHKFLKDNIWMFGTAYTRLSKSEKWMTIKSRNDFLLRRSDGYFDILDLKSPRFDLFVNIRGGKRAISKDLKDAISQVMVYLSEARTYYLSIKEQTGMDIYFPKGIIVIGKRSEKDKAMLKIHNEFLNKIEIWTYDEYPKVGK